MGIRIIKNNKLWMEDEAIHQLERIALFKNVVDVIGLPDLHPAKTPVGTTVKTQKLIYPILIGNDIGCGVSLYDIDMKIKKVNLEKVLKKLSKTSIIGEYSIGGGNHFIEMTQLDKIYDHKYIDILNLNQRHLYLMIHSGSRNRGEYTYRQYATLEGLKVGTVEFDNYIKEHN